MVESKTVNYTFRIVAASESALTEAVRDLKNIPVVTSVSRPNINSTMIWGKLESTSNTLLNADRAITEDLRKFALSHKNVIFEMLIESEGIKGLLRFAD